MYAAILFDLDGLLIDSEAIFHAVELQLLQDAGIAEAPARAALQDLVGSDEKSGKAKLAARFPDVDLAALDGQRTRRVQEAMARGIPVRPRVHDLLDALDGMGLRRAVATNSSRASAQRKLALTGLAGRVHGVVGHDMVDSPKPAPDIYVAAARLLDEAPEDCLAFEDSDMGAEAAHRAGCTVVQVPNLIATRGAFAHHLAETVWDGALVAGLRLPEAAKGT